MKEHNPSDVEAAHKAKDLAASETIARGGYEDSSKTHAVVGTVAKAPSPGKPGSNPKIKLPAEAESEAPVDRLTRDTAPILKRLEADPTEPTLYVQLAAVYRRHGEDDRAKATLQQGLGPTGNHFTLQVEMMDLDLLPFRKNLEHTEARLAKLKSRGADDDDDGPTESELLAARAKFQKEILAREAELLRVKALLTDVEAWRRVNDLRAYTTAVEKRAADRGQPTDASPELAKWLTWARELADRLDPITHRLNGLLGDPQIHSANVEPHAATAS